MSKNEVTRTFPEQEPLGLNPDHFKGLLSKAVKSYLEVLQQRYDLNSYPRRIFRHIDNKIKSEELLFPRYPSHLLDWAETALEVGDIASFMEYVWGRGELRKTLTGPDPQRRSWEWFVLLDVIHHPLFRVLTESAIEEAIDVGRITYWALDDQLFEKLLDEVTLECLQNKKKYVVQCPLGMIDGEKGNVWELGENITLKFFTEREELSYLTRNHNKLHWHEKLTGLGLYVGILEIVSSFEISKLRKGAPPKNGADLIEEQIADTVDAIKWALSSACGTSCSFVEGTITYEHILGGQFVLTSPQFFRREDKNGGTVHRLTGERIEIAKGFIEKIVRYRDLSLDLKQALWHWGRSSLADLDRDALLESIIGLESLLVPGSGDSRYRFGLHGAALLCTPHDNLEERARDLKKLYDRRSRIAHGSRDAITSDANRGRRSLADAICAVIALLEAGVLEPSEVIAEQIESIILKKSPLRP
ncbi:MAG: hypothetical protein KAT62_15105 [Desulfuromonadales bacterium]|nr:hypothetical protein [Desulfuromonadales bacterium]